MDYAADAIPVDVKLNGIYKGSYILTNKPGINAGSVDIDEDNSIMFELDTYFDEPYKFRSDNFKLPVMVSDPEVTDQIFEYWKNDFNEAENAVFTHTNVGDYFDLDVYARYMLVYDITKNDELQHPKSVKLYKTKGEGNKYIFGPVWDFDGAWSYWTTYNHYSTSLIGQRVKRCEFFQELDKEPEFQEAYRKYFRKIKDNLPELLSYIDEYEEFVRNSGMRNYEMKLVTKTDKDFVTYVQKMKDWLITRLDKMEEFEIVKQPSSTPM